MRTLTTTIVLSAAALGVMALAGTAHGMSADGEHIGYIKRPTTSYSSPSNQSTPVHFGLQPGQPANILCFTEGQSLDGNNYWFRIGQDGKLGFVHRDAIAPGVGMPHC